MKNNRNLILIVILVVLLCLVDTGAAAEVWVGLSGASQIAVYDFDGEYLRSYETSTGVGAIDVVPEPATLGLLLIGGLALFRRRLR